MKEEDLSSLAEFPPSISAVFLDRDGVINEEAGIVREREQLRLIEGVGAAIRRLNELDLPVVVITNQPVIARGWATEEDVKEFHDHLAGLLEDEGARIDGWFFCPHHENANDPAYRTECECRKPRPGLLRQAAKEMDIELGRSVMVGDRTVDLQAGFEAGCGGVYLVRTGFGGSDGKCEVEPDGMFDDLCDFTRQLDQWLTNR